MTNGGNMKESESCFMVDTERHFQHSLIHVSPMEASTNAVIGLLFSRTRLDGPRAAVKPSWVVFSSRIPVQLGVKCQVHSEQRTGPELCMLTGEWTEEWNAWRHLRAVGDRVQFWALYVGNGVFSCCPAGRKKVSLNISMRAFSWEEKTRRRLFSRAIWR